MIKRVGHINDPNNKNPSRGRIYSSEGISPTLVCPSGGHSVPYLVENNMKEIKFKYGLGVPRYEGKGLSREYKEGNRVHGSEGISPTLPANGGGAGGSILIEENMKEAIKYNRKDGVKDIIDIAGTLSSSDWRGLNRNQDQTAVLEREEDMNPNDILKLASVSNTERKEHIKNKTIPDVEANIKDDLCIATRHLGRNGGLTSELSPTVQASETPHITNNFRIRKLTPLECERLQGYPDGQTEFGKNKEGIIYKISNSQRYKMIGNGVSSPVSKHILETLLPEGKIKVMSTFSGCGGTEALLDKRFQIVGLCEFDKYASDVLRHIHPDITNYGDITKISEELLPDFDLLLGGFPCTDISIAGKQKGFKNEDGTNTRSGLFFNLIKIMKAKNPKYIMFENVKNLLSIENGQLMELVMTEISQLGYSVDFKLVNSKDYGLAQNRQRVFIIGVKK